MLGLIWLARGRVRTALRFCRESAALLRDGDGSRDAGLRARGRRPGRGAGGRADAARAAVAEMERTPLGHKGFAVELGLARAWSAAAGGELTRARALAREAAALARSRGQDALRGPRAARALPARRPGRRRARARGARRPGRRAVRRDRGRARRRARRRRRRRAARGRRALRGRRTRCSWPPRRRTRRPPPTATPAGRRAPAPPPRAPASGWPSCEGARPPTLLAAPRRRRPDAARARDRAARRRRVEQPRDRRAGSWSPCARSTTTCRTRTASSASRAARTSRAC